METIRPVIPEGYELTKVHKRRPRPKVDRGVAKLPFAGEEWSLIEKYAPTFEWESRGARRGGERGELQPGFTWDLCLVLRGGAGHISTVGILTSDSVFEDGKFLRLRWVRPKESRQKLVWPPLLPRSDFDPWVRRFLDLPKPKTEQAYSHLFRSLSDHIEKESGRRVKINGLRFRHTGFVRWLHEFNIPRRTVCVWGGTTERTLSFYDNPPDSDIAEMLEGKGLL